MRYIKYLTIVLLFIVAVSSCESDYEDNMGITSSVEWEYHGGNPIVLFKGTPYVEPGVDAFEIIGEDTTKLDVEILNEVNVDITHSYKLVYKAVNSEGFEFYKTRKVNIVSFTGYDVIELPVGTYDGIRVNRNAGGEVTITKLATGVYQISDLLGGYYDQYVGYGPEYAAPGILVVGEDGKVRSELGSGGFGATIITNFSYDSVNKVITYTQILTDQGNFSFDVKLTFKE